MSSMISSLVVGFLLVFSFANAQSNGVPKLDLETQFYEEVAEDSLGQEVKVDSFLSEIPDGLSNKHITPECDPHRFEDRLLKTKISTAEYYVKVKDFFAKCSGEFTANSTLGVLGLLKFARYQYNFLSHPQVKEFVVKLPNGTRVPGILALKTDPRPRPLVIVKCGVFCSAAQTASMKTYLMHLFDQSPFNVLMLANQTGIDYIYHNKRVSLGGWTEGYEALQVGKWMREKWEYKDRISSIHLMGISLGGNAAVMGASYNDRFPMNDGRKVFNSVTAICPVVSLKPTLERLFGSKSVGRVFSVVSKRHFKAARNFVSDVPDLITDEKIPSSRFDMADFIGTLAATSLKRRGVDIPNTESFFKANNFWNLKAPVETPMLVWASKDDMIVHNDINAAVVEHDNYYEKSSNVGVLNFKYGNHCAFSSSYGTQISAAVLRTFVLAHSPEFVDEYNHKEILPWPFAFENLGPEYEHVGQSWNFYSRSERVKVSFRLFDWKKSESCRKKGPWKAEGECISTKEYWLPISSLKVLGAKVPTTDSEAQALTREFNTKIEFRIDGHPLNGTNQNKFYMTWKSRF